MEGTDRREAEVRIKSNGAIRLLGLASNAPPSEVTLHRHWLDWRAGLAGGVLFVFFHSRDQ
jgi:hypothetical protein